MFESFSRGFRMIMASVKMGWQDKRLLIPSILTVFTNLFFGVLLIMQEAQRMQHHGQNLVRQTAAFNQSASGGVQGMQNMLNMTQLNGPGDQSGFDALGGLFTADNGLLVTSLVMVWWLTNRFLEGVTTALVYAHLTEGRGAGKFSTAVSAVVSSLPAIVMLGVITFIARRAAGWMRNKRNSGVLGMGFNFLAGVVEVFWTLAGHLILPAIVIEGTSFWGGMKRADKIAQGNLLTIGVGEVGVDIICRLSTWGLYGIGAGCFALGTYFKINMLSPAVVVSGVIWMAAAVFVTALSIYIRSAFYTCLYVWAIESEAVEEAERSRIKPPEPLAAALA